MRALRVVGLTEDGDVVLEDPVRLERFRVPADERLRAAARGDLSRLGQIAIELESQLRPREIQARIRAGASVEQVAAAAGVPEQKIERFAYPVLLERFRTAENAQRAHPVRADGPENRTLAEVVAHTFGLRGQAYEGARWDSWKGEDGRWVVALGWRAGRSENRAHWTFQPGAHGGTVTALDEHASDLVEGLPARPLRTVGAVVDMNRPEEEPPPAPSPVEQWRAAASDSYRERIPHPSEPPRPAADRGAGRSAEPWRPAAPAQRQAEPVEARQVEARQVEARQVEARQVEARQVEARSGDQRTGSYRGADARPERDTAYRAAAEWAPAERVGVAERPEPAVPEQARAEPARSEPAHSDLVHSDLVHSEPAGSERTRPEPAPPEPAPAVSPPAEPGPWDRGRIPEDTPPSAAPAPVEVARAEVAPTEVAPTEVAPVEVAPSTVPAAPEPLAVEPAVAAPELAAPEVVERSVTAPDVTEPEVPAPDVPAPGATKAALPVPAAPPALETPAAEVPEAEPAVEAPTAQEAAAAAPAVAMPAVEAPAADSPAAGRRTRKGKPVMPSWDEVLLGVRGPR